MYRSSACVATAIGTSLDTRPTPSERTREMTCATQAGSRTRAVLGTARADPCAHDEGGAPRRVEAPGTSSCAASISMGAHRILRSSPLGGRHVPANTGHQMDADHFASRATGVDNSGGVCRA